MHHEALPGLVAAHERLLNTHPVGLQVLARLGAGLRVDGTEHTADNHEVRRAHRAGERRCDIVVGKSARTVEGGRQHGRA